MIVAWKVYKIVSNQNYLVSFSCYFSMTNLENFINANENKGRDCICGAEGANNDVFRCESLRQKYSCWTRLWRELYLDLSHQRGKPLSVNFQVQGQRPSLTKKGVFCPFFVNFST
jgi:hypothetical protein